MMKLFEAIPENLFTILTSKNKDIYVSSLLVLHDAFKQDVTLEKETMTSLIINKLHSELYDFDELQDGHEKMRDVSSKAHFVVRKLIDTGWIEIEYNRVGGLVEYVTLPPYSIKLIDLLYSLVNEEVKEYDSFMYAMYSSLINAEEKYNDYRFTALLAVYDKLNDFEQALKSLYHDLRRRYNSLANLKTVNQVLREHFDSYQKEIIRQIYLPLKTKDSINRFKGPILTILSKWLRDDQIMDQIIKQSIISNQYKDADEAKSGIIYRLNHIVDKLYELEDLVAMIDERNATYVSAATSKMKYLLKNDRSSKGKLSKIIQSLAYDVETPDDLLPYIQHTLAVFPQNYLNEHSLYSRKDARDDRDDEPLEIITLTQDDKDEMFMSWAGDKNINKFSHRDVIHHMHSMLENKKTISSDEIDIPDVDALIYVMHAFIKGYDPNIFYKLEMHEGQVTNNQYEIPNFNFTRRRQ